MRGTLHSAGRRVGAALGATALSVGILVGGFASAAGAATTVPMTGTAYGINGDGSTGAALFSPVTQSQDFDMTAPTEVNETTDFDLVLEGALTSLPSTQLGIPINELSNFQFDITVTGATALATPVLSGGDVLGATASIVGGNVIHVVLPGTVAGAISPGNTNHFVPGGSFTPPDITVTATAGASGSTITTAVTEFQSDATVLGGAINARAIFAPDSPNPDLSTTQVVTPPPPGAPNAVADTAVTDQDVPVTVDVLANDVPDSDAAIDTATLAVVADPAHGAAVVNAGQIDYTPESGYAGSDSFDYEVCSVSGGACDSATVTVTVNAPPPPSSTPTSTAPGNDPSPSTTPGSTSPGDSVSPGDTTGDTLPATGSSDGPNAAIGIVLVSVGLAAVAVFRPRRRVGSR